MHMVNILELISKLLSGIQVEKKVLNSKNGLKIDLIFIFNFFPFKPDAKNRYRTTDRQDEDEWIQYKNSMDFVIKESGLEKRVFFDLRGNHDKYGVPYVGSYWDFFSKYSIRAQLNRTSSIQSSTLIVSYFPFSCTSDFNQELCCFFISLFTKIFECDGFVNIQVFFH